MNKFAKIVVATALLTASSMALAAKSYQVTGTVLEVSDTKIVVDKKGEKFEIEKTAASKMTGQPTVGGKVTVYYTMSAVEIEAKADTKSKKK